MQQQYCLRWNNHKNNLLSVFGELFRNENFTDVTLACEGGSFIKCHKMVLAASSSYFQNLFSNLPCSHPVVVLKDIRYREIQAILEYMYKGEVSITQEEVEPLLRVAEALKVKGLVGENNYRSNNNEYTYRPNNSIRTSSSLLSTYDRVSNRDISETHSSTTGTSSSLPNDLNSRNDATNDNENVNDSLPNEHRAHIGDDKNIRNDSSPSRYPYFCRKTSNTSDKSDHRVPPLPIWSVTGLPVPTFPTPQTNTSTTAMLNSCHHAVITANNVNIPPLRRKKLSSLLSSRETDTPILRTFLGQGQIDSSLPMSLVGHNAQDQELQSNGPTVPQDLSYMNKNETNFQSMKIETMSEDGYPPCMESSSFIDKDFNIEKDSRTMNSSSSSPQSYYIEAKGSVSSDVPNCVSSQKPEWKRYKQYTRLDITSAIESVRNGMTALKAAKKFGVPSRTLYDKVKKLGITTTRPSRRSSSGNGVAFPYGLSGAGDNTLLGVPMLDEDESSSQDGILEHGFSQHALERANLKMENSDREEMASVPTTSLLTHGCQSNESEIEESMSTSGMEESAKFELSEREAVSFAREDISGIPSSPVHIHRSLSPNLIEYAQRCTSSTPPMLPPTVSPPVHDYQDQVEDLSMSRKPELQSRVIMPPMNRTAASDLLISYGENDGKD